MVYNPGGRKESYTTERLLCVCVCVCADLWVGHDWSDLAAAAAADLSKALSRNKTTENNNKKDFCS